MPVGGGTGVLGVTRNIAVPWPGTVALIVPVLMPVFFDHRSLTVYEGAPPMPTACTVVVRVAS